MEHYFAELYVVTEKTEGGWQVRVVHIYDPELKNRVSSVGQFLNADHPINLVNKDDTWSHVFRSRAAARRGIHEFNRANAPYYGHDFDAHYCIKGGLH